MKYLFTLFLCIQFFTTQAQQYTIKKLGLEKKLSNNYIIDIAEDKNGYIWLATEDGLNKLEGGVFSPFYKKDKGKSLNLTGNELNCLLDDPQKPILWIGTQRAGLNAFNYQTNEQIIFQHDPNDPHSIATNDVTDLAIAADGNLWITTYWRGIKYLNKETRKFTHYNQETVPDLPSNTIWTVIDDHKGSLYIGHAQHGMSILSIKDKKIKNFTYNKQESGEHQASGTGIGLALVKNLVKLHEGDIQVKSLPEIGTTFYLRLPAGNTYPQALHGEDIHTDKQDGKEEEPIEKQEVADKDKNARPIILVVEDNADIRDYIADAFTDLYEVKTASNGKEGLHIATETIPDIVVSDIMMPVMNGIIMCQKLKSDIRTSHIPVILLTAKDSITDKEEGYQAGADSYLTKPFSASLLQSRISNLLTQRRLLSERFAIRPEKPERQSMEEKRAIITESMNKLDKEFLDKITNTITKGLAAAENIDITVLSNVMCMSSSTLYRKVKALTGMSTNEYIRKIKMQLAEKYLLEGKYSISEIAFKVGINSNVYFRQCFKEEFGMSASDYLKQLTGKSIDEKVDE